MVSHGCVRAPVPVSSLPLGETYRAGSGLSGFLGFERCLRNEYDLVICDVRMPLILGTELVAELRRDLPELPVVLISAFADDQLVAQAHERGAWLLSKPFDAAVLGAVLEQATGPQPVAC